MKTYIYLIVLVLLAANMVNGAGKVSDSKNVQLTVYNSNFALIKDMRTVNLDKGISSIDVEDVAAMIDPTSVLFKSLTAPNAVSILEQNYQYDLISPDNILNKSVGERLTFTSFDINGKPYTQFGTLLSPPSNGGVVVKTDDGKVTLWPSGQVSLEKMPNGLHPRPTLNWLLDTDKAGEQNVEISYITNGISWNADYVALVNKDDSKLDLTGWVTLANNSGATYKDAKLTLMAGDVRRVQKNRLLQGIGAGVMYGAKAASPQFEEKSFFEYHIYKMQRLTTIANKESKQLSLLGATGANINKDMVYDGRKSWWSGWWYPGRNIDPGSGNDTSEYHKVNVVLEVKNSKENSMGMPLPKGRIRVYKLDSDGSQQFIGEDSIDHTPKDEKIRLYIGDAFDVVGDHKRTNYKKISDKVIEQSFEIKVRNHKKEAVTVKVVEHVWGDWKITSKSDEFVKKDARTIEFPVKVPADGEKVVTYTVRIK